MLQGPVLAETGSSLTLLDGGSKYISITYLYLYYKLNSKFSTERSNTTFSIWQMFPSYKFLIIFS